MSAGTEKYMLAAEGIAERATAAGMNRIGCDLVTGWSSAWRRRARPRYEPADVGGVALADQ
ncbi:MAG TPA: hypothetical protein VJN18_24775 [Polyangiaceae bacterium]|nr:hypothetical protein [Polyangiaceae bacterium]